MIQPLSSLRALGFALAVAAMASPTLAQPSTSTACRDMPTDADRIACLESRNAELEARLQALEATVLDEPSVATEFDANNVESQRPTVVDPAEPTRAAAPRTTPAPTERRGFGLRLPRVPFMSRGSSDGDGGDEPLVEPSTALASQEAVDPNSFGAEQVARRNGEMGAGGQRDEDDEVMVANLVGFETLRRGRLVFELDNGQVWRQTDIVSIPPRLREGEPVQVEVWRSGFGGYRMRLVEKRSVLRVERIE